MTVSMQTLPQQLKVFQSREESTIKAEDNNQPSRMRRAVQDMFVLLGALATGMLVTGISTGVTGAIVFSKGLPLFGSLAIISAVGLAALLVVSLALGAILRKILAP